MASVGSAAANGEKGVICLDMGGGQGLRTQILGAGWEVGTSHLSLPLLCQWPCFGQWPEVSEVVSRPPSDPHLHQNTKLERVAWTWCFTAILWKPKSCTPGVGWGQGVVSAELRRMGGLCWWWRGPMKLASWPDGWWEAGAETWRMFERL